VEIAFADRTNEVFEKTRLPPLDVPPAVAISQMPSRVSHFPLMEIGHAMDLQHLFPKEFEVIPLVGIADVSRDHPNVAGCLTVIKIAAYERDQAGLPWPSKNAQIFRANDRSHRASLSQNVTQELIESASKVN